MRFGLDVAQQRMSWDENVSRVQFAEELGFDGVWGFDHFQPMYGVFDMAVDPADMERIDELSEKYRYQPFANQGQVDGYPDAPGYW